MSYKPHELPESTLRLMSKEDRKSLAVQTSADADASFVAKSEKEMHDKFAQWCDLHGVIYVHARMDKKSTIAKGVFDFCCLKNERGCFVEFKYDKRLATPEQNEFMQSCYKSNTRAFIAYGVESAIAFVKEALKI